MRSKSILFLYLCLLLLNLLQAEEGMFPPYQIPTVKGLKLKPQDLFNPIQGAISDAVIIIGGGTGSFVSPSGLVLTNHHVAFDAIKTNSTPERDLLENGFYACQLSEELPARGYEAYQTIAIEDVSAKILRDITDATPPAERVKLINQHIAQIEKESEDQKNGIQGKVAVMLEGKEYRLVKYLRFRDVRLVYAPPRSIGNYGGEVDNWMWPRHTGDFSFMRVYVAPDGKPARFNPQNVPYKPTRYLPIATKGFKPDDLVFIMGYPGNTNRNRTSYAIYYSQEVVYPFRIKLFQTIIDILEEQSQQSKEVELLLASELKGFYNSIKNNRGLLEGFKKDDLLNKKRAQEQAFLKKISKSRQLQQKYGYLLPEIKQAYDEYYSRSTSDMIIEYLRVVTLLSDAVTIYKYSLERVKPDSLRAPGYQDFQIARTRDRLEDQRQDFYPPADAAILKMMLKELAQYPVNERPALINSVIGTETGAVALQHIDNFVDELYAKTKLVDVAATKKMFDLSTAELVALNDPLLNFAAKLNEEYDRLKIKNDQFTGKLNKLHPLYFQALQEQTGQNFIPDANRTLRFSYGRVKGYYPRDGIYYLPQTGLKGIVEKNTGQEPFDAPAKLTQLYQQKNFEIYQDTQLHDVPVAFLATTDITGGNSGSPVLNAQGAIVGCAFDGNWEALTNDWQYNPDITRTIAVDIRYVLFVLDKFSGAQNLLKELTLQ